MRLPLVLAVASLLVPGIAAHADTVSVFDITGQSQFYSGSDHNTISGSIVIDTTSGKVEDISFTAGGVYQSGLDSQSGTSGPALRVGSDNLPFVISGVTLVGFKGDNFNLNAESTLGDIYVGHVVYEGPYTPPSSVTPEPSSLLLLSTGLLGIGAIVKRQFA